MNKKWKRFILEIKKFSEVVNWSSETIIKQIKMVLIKKNPEIFVNIAFNALRELIDKKNRTSRSL